MNPQEVNSMWRINSCICNQMQNRQREICLQMYEILVNEGLRLQSLQTRHSIANKETT